MTTDLQIQLAGPLGAQVRAQLDRELTDTERRLVGDLATQLPPAEFAAIFASLQAVRAAQAVVRGWPVGSTQISGESRRGCTLVTALSTVQPGD
jgi:hypothetical protein